MRLNAAATLLAATALIAPGSAVLAQSGSAEALVQSFARCRAIVAADARLDCFDKAAQSLEKAVAAKDITIVDRQEVRKAQRSLFGFTVGRIPIFGGSDHDSVTSKRDTFDQLDTTVVSVQPLANGNYQMRVAEGDAIWLITDPVPFPPRSGTKVSIKRGAMGNYFINIAGQRSVRGSRLR